MNVYAEGQAPIVASVLAEEVLEETAMANAQLVAAAPELLEACRAAMQEIDALADGLSVSEDLGDQQLSLGWANLAGTLREAIHKATGT